MNVSKIAFTIVLALACPAISSSKVIEPERAQGGLDDHGIAKTGSDTFLRRTVEQPDATVDGVDIVVDSLNSPDTDIVADVAVVDGRQRKDRRLQNENLYVNYVPALGNFEHNYDSETVGTFFTFERSDWERVFGNFGTSFTTGTVTVCNSNGGRKVTKLQIWDRDSVRPDKDVFTWVDTDGVDTDEDFWGIYGRTMENPVNFNKPDVRIYNGKTSCEDKYTAVTLPPSMKPTESPTPWSCNPSSISVISDIDDGTYLFKRKGSSDRICGDFAGNEYSYYGIKLADGDDAEDCAYACIIVLPSILKGYDWNCKLSLCNCLYEKEQLLSLIDDSLLIPHNIYIRFNQGSGNILKTSAGLINWQCYSFDEIIYSFDETIN